MKNNVYNSDSDSDGQARGGRRAQNSLTQALPQLPTSSGLSQPAGKSLVTLIRDHNRAFILTSHSRTGQLLRGATDENGNQKAAALLVGIKLDLEAEVHLTARVRGDICIGLY